MLLDPLNFKFYFYKMKITVRYLISLMFNQGSCKRLNVCSIFIYFLLCFKEKFPRFEGKLSA
ncbi:rCG56329, isoform CRA_a [Rattus norvegicus]|uniref:RCG56329, isoform CRA_a n=1 Tax=Rattus norvegicus TaxID=10116 RepID=A6IBC8_RAT|nr:rCG56329, isoform CRA_a [Rattus norvegicus]